MAEALGATVTWDAVSQTVLVEKDGTGLQLFIGKTVMFKGDEKLQMDVAPEVVSPGRTMLPIRFVAESLGADVDWNEKDKKVMVSLSR